jgi:hypothetical protein
MTGIAEKRKVFRVLPLYSPIRASLFTEKATSAFLLVDPKAVLPGKGSFRAGIDTRFGFACYAEKNLFLLWPIG